MSAFFWSLFLVPHAHAFCGTYVGTDGAPVRNHASQVVVAVDGAQTVLTLANDFDGDASNFGLVIPLPGTVTPADVTVTTRAALDTLDAYTAPRLVAYSCDDVVWIPGETGGWEGVSPDGSSSGCGGSASSSPTLSGSADSGGSGGYESGGGLGSSMFEEGATSEHFTAGEYELDLVSADDVVGLQAWLDTNGFALPTGADAVIAEAVSGGANFLVARVSAEGLSTERQWLSPIQVRYAGTEVVLPLRLGATASDGEQDILVYGINRTENGALAVANYPHVDVDSHCLLSDELTAGYEAELARAFESTERAGRAGWVLEFLSQQGVCDPLPPEGTIESGVLSDLGFGDGIENATLSRLHVRGGPTEIDQDLVLYATGVNQYWQQDYIAWADHMDAYFRVCGTEEITSTDSCPEPDYDPPSYGSDDEDPVAEAEEDDERNVSGLCASGVLGPFLVYTLAALLRRRRDQD